MRDNTVFFDTQPEPWVPRRYAAIGPPPADPGFDANGRELEDGGTLGFAFGRAAGYLAQLWADETDDTLALVVVYNYRHALELGLKAVIRALIACEREQRSAGVERQVQHADKRLERTHSLEDLVEILQELARSAGWTLAPIVADVCLQLHHRDPAGDYFRYPEVKPGGGAPSRPARLAPLYVDVPRFAYIASEACGELEARLEGEQQRLHDLVYRPDAGDAAGT